MNESRDCMSMPHDSDLIDPLGRITWAAIRLQHGVRDCFNKVRGCECENLFDYTLGQAIRKLEKEARKKDNQDVLEWCNNNITKSAVKGRNNVIHGVSITKSDGTQGLTRNPPVSGQQPFTPEYLLDVADKLVKASKSLPEG